MWRYIRYFEIEDLNDIEINSFNVKTILNDLGDHDASFFVDIDNFYIFFQTDNLMSINYAEDFRKKNNLSKKIDIAFMMFYQTGAYPLFFDDDENLQLDRLRKKDIKSITYTKELAKILEPKIVIPYASDIFYDPKVIKKNPHIEKIKNYWDSDIKLYLPDQGSFTNDCSKFYKLKEEELLTYKNLDESFSKKIDLNDFLKKLKKYLNNKSFNVLDNKEIFSLGFKISIGHSSIYGCIRNNKIVIKNFFKKQDVNLEIDIDSNRLSMCFDEYNGWLGLMELWNGGLRCKRYDDIYTNVEKQFWMTLFRFNYS